MASEGSHDVDDHVELFQNVKLEDQEMTENNEVSVTVPAAVKDEPVTPSPKKRGRPNKKITIDTDVKGNDGSETQPTPTTPVTPGSRKRGRGKVATSVTIDGNANRKNAEDDDLMASPTKKSRNDVPGSAQKTPSTPTSSQAICMEDRMLIRMREEEGKTWKEITAVWEAITDAKLESTTLRKRYQRIKTNLVVFQDGDVGFLSFFLFLKVKKDIEEKFELEKWTKIAVAIESEGGNKYPPAACQKKFKEISKHGRSQPGNSPVKNGNTDATIKAKMDLEDDDELA